MNDEERELVVLRDLGLAVAMLLDEMSKPDGDVERGLTSVRKAHHAWIESTWKEHRSGASSDAGFRDVVGTALEQVRTMQQNLTAVQHRCTELLMEVRRLRARHDVTREVVKVTVDRCAGLCDAAAADSRYPIPVQSLASVLAQQMRRMVEADAGRAFDA